MLEQTTSLRIVGPVHVSGCPSMRHPHERGEPRDSPLALISQPQQMQNKFYQMRG
ncbi:MAG: hypothetical protein MJE68_17220 [Proteobacteria bacterium]|nr:hypothetical protein [Pseudomonadota bacterium]